MFTFTSLHSGFLFRFTFFFIQIHFKKRSFRFTRIFHIQTYECFASSLELALIHVFAAVLWSATGPAHCQTNVSHVFSS